MKKYKELILIVFVFIISIIILLFSLISQNKSKNENLDVQTNQQINEQTNNVNESTNETIKFNSVNIQTSANLLKNPNQFFSVANCVNQYINNINKQDNEAIYALLDNKYINEKNISKDKIFDIIKKFDKDKNFYPEEMYVKSGTVNTFYVKGYIDNADAREQKNKESYYICVLIDNSNNTFCVIPLNESEFDSKKDIGERSFIPKNDFNTVKLTKVTNEFLCNKAFNEYKSLLLYNYDKAYEKLDVEYRNKRFKDKKEFVNYLNEYKEEILKVTMLKYAVNYEDDYTEYVCMDQYNNYYVFKDISVMNYTAKLDAYTIPTDEYKSQYDDSGDSQKVTMNVQKIIEMLNNRDYENIYNYLDDTFKANNYPTFQDFKNIIKNALPSKYQIISSEHIEQTNFYVDNIKLQDYNNTDNVIDFTIIIRLDENGKDFKISFSS